MKLNFDCIRDILLTLEDVLEYSEDLNFPAISLDDLCIETNSNSKNYYNRQDIAYSCLKLKEANYIQAEIADCDSCILDIICFDITFEGHKYLDTVRNSDIWSAIKAKFKEKSLEMSIDGIITLGTKLITSCITQ